MKIEWIKLCTDLFDNRKIKHIRKMDGGNDIALIWVMLLTMAGKCNDGGRIYLTESIPYDAEMLSDELGFDVETIENALRVMRRFDMVEYSEDELCIVGWEEYQNIDGMEKYKEDNRERQKRFRQKKAMQKDNVTDDVTSNVTRNVTDNVTVTPQIKNKKEIRIEREDIRDNARAGASEPPEDVIRGMFPDDPDLSAALCDWVHYKEDHGVLFTETMLKDLLSQAKRAKDRCGPTPIIDAVQTARANGWTGVRWDKIDNIRRTAGPPTSEEWLRMWKEV